MRLLFVALGMATLLIVALVWLFFRSRLSPSERIQREVAASVAAAKADIARMGWHIVMVEGEDSPGFLYTIGLWQSYRHPELLVVASGREAGGMAGRIASLGQRVAAGESFTSGAPIERAFGEHQGAAKEIQKTWYPNYLGIAGAVYEDFEFPAMQVFWPDREGLFPWQAQADPELFRFQPLLDQENPIFANLGRAQIAGMLEEEGGKERLDAALNELFVPTTAAQDLLESWRWLVGSEVEIFKLTVFGDMILAESGGQLHWLDTGWGTFEELPATRDSWLPTFYSVAFELVHVRLLLELKAADFALKDGQVFDWRLLPMAGGATSRDNVHRLSLVAATSASGQLAQYLRQSDRSADSGFAEATSDEIFAVVINEDEEYSMWPVSRPVPKGWKLAGKQGTKQECLDYIEEVWVDMRPKGLRN